MSLSLTRQIVISEDQHGVSHKPGHQLVVFDVVDNGLQNGRVVPHGERVPFKRNGLISWMERVSIAVNMTDGLRHTFHRPFTHKDGAHQFYMRFIMSFRVVDPLMLVTARDRDPVFLLQEEVARVIGGSVACVSWPELVANKQHDNGAELAAAALAADQKVLDAYAGTYGLALNAVHMRIDFSKEESELIGRKVKRERDKELNQIAHEDVKDEKQRQHELEAIDGRGAIAKELQRGEQLAIEQRNRVYEILINHFDTATGTLASNVRTVEDLFGIIGKLQGAANGMRMPGTDAASSDGLSLLAGRQTGLLPAVASSHPTVIAISEALRQFSPVGEEHPQRTRLLASLVHWLAESLLEQHANRETLERYEDEITGLVAQLPGGPSDEQHRFIERVLTRPHRAVRRATGGAQ